MEWAKDQYNKQYEQWVPWLEDLYLRYFTKDNKASYTAKRKPAVFTAECESVFVPLTPPQKNSTRPR